MISERHCERSEAIHLSWNALIERKLDCFVASAPRNDASKFRTAFFGRLHAGAGSRNPKNMLVICPTCQNVFCDQRFFLRKCLAAKYLSRRPFVSVHGVVFDVFV